jgi:hypothetical protein
MYILSNGDVDMRNRDRVSWEMLLRLLLEDIEAMTAENSGCAHEKSYLLDEIDKNFEGKATNGYGVEIDFDKISMVESYNELMDMERRREAEEVE